MRPFCVFGFRVEVLGMSGNQLYRVILVFTSEFGVQPSFIKAVLFRPVDLLALFRNLHNDARYCSLAEFASM